MERIASLPEDADKRFELINGVIEEVMPPSVLHTYISNRFGRFLDTFVEEHELGYVFGDGCTYVLSEENELIPDCSFVSKTREIRPPFGVKFYFAPDLAVEVISPSNSAQQMMAKIETYLSHGTKCMWVAYPQSQDVYSWRMAPDGTMSVQKFDINATLDGEDVLPGFRLEVRRVFPE
jgi:Uma2 family endonuclease